jgi:hypothetical protein
MIENVIGNNCLIEVRDPTFSAPLRECQIPIVSNAGKVEIEQKYSEIFEPVEYV